VETENGSEIIAAQGLEKRTKYYATEVFRSGTYNKRRICQQYEEALDLSLGKRT